jgi:hypothetical protein
MWGWALFTALLVLRLAPLAALMESRSALRGGIAKADLDPLGGSLPGEGREEPYCAVQRQKEANNQTCKATGSFLKCEVPLPSCQSSGCLTRSPWHAQ